LRKNKLLIVEYWLVPGTRCLFDWKYQYINNNQNKKPNKTWFGDDRNTIIYRQRM